MVDLSNKSLAELRQLHLQVNEQITVRQQNEVSEVREQIEALAASVGMSVVEIMKPKAPLGKKLSKPVPARYQNPENATEQWSGRGRKPRWFVNYLASTGKDITSLLIK